MPDEPRWTNLQDPTAEEIESRLPNLHPSATALLRAAHTEDREPRPQIRSHGDYVFGVLLVPVAVPQDARVYYQELDFVLSKDEMVTVTKTPPDGEAFDPSGAIEACQRDQDIGMYAFRLVDDVAERFLDLVDDVNDTIDTLEDRTEELPSVEMRRHIATVRHTLLHIHRILAPTRDAVHRIVDDRVELDHGELFPRNVELHFADVYDKLLRANDGLEISRDLLAGVRDYLQAKIANDQNEVVKRLTAIASLLLVPTFIVGLYGQNFIHMPEYRWQLGYLWSWGLIIATTVFQLIYFRRKNWL